MNIQDPTVLLDFIRPLISHNMANNLFEQCQDYLEDLCKDMGNPHIRKAIKEYMALMDWLEHEFDIKESEQ